MQGDGAVRDLVRALELVNRIPGLELCIVGRGGGGREDLAAFNSEAVCRALAAVRVPTISAVGHETDISLTDLVADLRAADAVRRRGDGRRRPPRGAPPAGRPRRAGSRAASGAAPGSAAERLARTRRPAAGARSRPCSRRERHRADRLAAQLDALSPLRVLDRGYAVPVDRRRPASSSAGRISVPGAPFRLRVADGDVGARVESDMSIAQDLNRLEEIVRKLEADDVELDAALALFEEGVARLRAARERLASAEVKVQTVLEEAGGPQAHRSRWLKPRLGRPRTC